MGEAERQARALEERTSLVERSRTLLAFAVFFYPGLYPLDRVIAPDNHGTIGLLRLCIAGLFGATFALTWTRAGQRWIRPISIVFASLASLGMVSFSVLNGGFSSDYAVGLIMVLLGGCYFLPWRLGDALAFCGISLGAYITANLATYGWSSEAWGPLLFVGGTCTIAAFATRANETSRRRGQDLRQDLRQANAELQELGELRTRFFANVSHELRTPLQLILGPLEELRRDAQGEELELLDSMWSNGRRLQRQVEQLLDVAKLEAGRAQVRPQPGNLGNVLQGLIAAARPHALQQGIDLAGVGLEDMPESSFDLEHVETIAGNLLSNALKYTPRGGQVTIVATAEGQHQRFQVRDTGLGIPADQLERVFDRFHQVERDAGRRGGTGLGLALTQELVELNEGTLSVTSALGQGSTFSVSLPLIPASSEMLSHPTPSRAASLDLPAVGVPEATERAAADAPRILVVEDNPELRRLLARQLGRRYRVDVAADGVAALDALELLQPDLVLSDVMMPRMDGFELCRQIRSRPELAAMPVILLTARSELDDLVGGLQLGADDYVTKPFHYSELDARIQALLRLKRAERQVHERNDRLAAVHMLADEISLEPPVADALNSVTSVQVRLDDDLAPQATPVAPYLHQVGADLADQLWNLGVELHVQDRSGGEARAFIDQAAMRRVIEGLVLNARDALVLGGQGEGVRHIWVTVEAAADVRIRVADDGVGVPVELAERLFRPLTKQGSGARRHRLSDLQATVAQHGGSIKLEPQAPEGGAAFTIKLPLTRHH
jgi:signal transduction histidine kinase